MYEYSLEILKVFLCLQLVIKCAGKNLPDSYVRQIPGNSNDLFNLTKFGHKFYSETSTFVNSTELIVHIRIFKPIT